MYKWSLVWTNSCLMARCFACVDYFAQCSSVPLERKYEAMPLFLQSYNTLCCWVILHSQFHTHSVLAFKVICQSTFLAESERQAVTVAVRCLWRHKRNFLPVENLALCSIYMHSRKQKEKFQRINHILKFGTIFVNNQKKSNFHGDFDSAVGAYHKTDYKKPPSWATQTGTITSLYQRSTRGRQQQRQQLQKQQQQCTKIKQQNRSSDSTSG